MPSPLEWDASRQWTFHISLRQPVFYLLRDHINMFTDLGKDWSSGPPSDYFTWVPMRYGVNLDLRNYVIHTYVNDHNIIDKPLLREENGLYRFSGSRRPEFLTLCLAAMLSLRGPTLRNESVIMSDKFRPAWTSFPFAIDAPDVALCLTLPKWSTHRLQTMEPITKLMSVGLLRLDGSYLYFSEYREENVDQLRLNFTVRRFCDTKLRIDCLYYTAQRRHIQVFGLVHTTFYDLSAELLWHFHELFNPRRVLEKARKRSDWGSYRPEVPS